MLFFLKKPMVGEKFLDFLWLGEKKSWYMDQLRSVVYRLWFTRVLYTLIWSHMLWIAIAIAIIRKIHWWGFRLHCPEKTTKQPPGPDFRCGPWDFFTFWQCLPIRKPYSSPWLQPPGGSLSFGFFARWRSIGCFCHSTLGWKISLWNFDTRIGSGVPMKSRFWQRHFKMCFIFWGGWWVLYEMYCYQM